MGVQYYKSGSYVFQLCFSIGEIISVAFVPNKQSQNLVLESVSPGIFSTGPEKGQGKSLVPLCDLHGDAK